MILIKELQRYQRSNLEVEKISVHLLSLHCNGKIVFQTLLGKGKNIAMVISRPSLLLQRTEGHTVSPVLLQMRGSQPGPGPHLGVASSSIRDLFCTNCFTLHLSTGRQHRQTHAPAATLGNTKSGPSYTFFYEACSFQNPETQ